MIRVDVQWSGIGDLADDLARLPGLLDIDMSGLGPIVNNELRKANRDARLRGLDRHGSVLIEVRDRADPRRGGVGPPLAPKEDASRSIANFNAQTLDASPGRLVVEYYWVGADFLRYHQTGTSRLPVRDIIGVDPETAGFIFDVHDDYVGRRVQEALDQTLPEGGR